MGKEVTFVDKVADEGDKINEIYQKIIRYPEYHPERLIWREAMELYKTITNEEKVKDINKIATLYQTLCDAGYKNTLVPKAYNPAIFNLIDKYWDHIPEEYKEGYAFFFDLNSLKDMNDAISYNVGDTYLRGVVDSIQKILEQYSKSPIIIRRGGDEFVGFIPYNNYLTNLIKPADIISRINHETLKYLERELEEGEYKKVMEWTSTPTISARGGYIHIGVSGGIVKMKDNLKEAYKDAKRDKISSWLGYVLDTAAKEMKVDKENNKKRYIKTTTQTESSILPAYMQEALEVKE